MVQRHTRQPRIRADVTSPLQGNSRNRICAELIDFFQVNKRVVVFMFTGVGCYAMLISDSLRMQLPTASATTS